MSAKKVHKVQWVYQDQTEDLELLGLKVHQDHQEVWDSLVLREYRVFLEKLVKRVQMGHQDQGEHRVKMVKLDHKDPQGQMV